MWRTVLGTLIGMLAGIAMTVLILYVTFRINAIITHPKIYEIEHGAIYLTIILGAGFGSLCGAMTGFASAMLRQWRQEQGRAQSVTAPTASPPPH